MLNRNNLFDKQENQLEFTKRNCAELRKESEALKEFCSLILCGHNEDVYQCCKYHLENSIEEDGIAEILYILSGYETYSEDSEIDPLVECQHYFISSDAGAPSLEDFFAFIEEGIMPARELQFSIHKENFSDEDCIIEWLAELAFQLKDLYIINFDVGSEDYHFTIMNKQDCERAMELFAKISSCDTSYEYSSMIITEDFAG